MHARRHVRWHIFPRFFAALALVSTSLVFPLGQHSSLAQDPAKIRFAFWGDPAEQAAYQSVVDTFETVHPEIDITVDYTANQGDYYRKITSDFAAGQPPSVFLTNYRQFGQFAAAGGLAPIQEHIDESAKISESDFYRQSLDAFRFGESKGGKVHHDPHRHRPRRHED